MYQVANATGRCFIEHAAGTTLDNDELELFRGDMNQAAAHGAFAHPKTPVSSRSGRFE
jgi:hypothetical protein